MKSDLHPYGLVSSVGELGRCVRAARKAQGATQTELAALCGVGVRFVSELENGKPTVELDKALQVLSCLGLTCEVQPRRWRHSVER